MKTIYTHFKNSNTNELILKQEFIESPIKFPTYYYSVGKITECVYEQPFNQPDTFDLTGFVPISERKFERIKKLKRKQL